MRFGFNASQALYIGSAGAGQQRSTDGKTELSGQSDGRESRRPGGTRIVARSIESADGLRCVDVFRAGDGRYRYDEWRRDPEDPAGWRPTGAAGTAAFDTLDDAVSAAERQFGWLRQPGGRAAR